MTRTRIAAALTAVALATIAVPGAASAAGRTNSTTVCTNGRVPNVIGLDPETAVGRMYLAGYKNIRVTVYKGEPAPYDTVRGQVPTAGARAERCTEVRVILAPN